MIIKYTPGHHKGRVLACPCDKYVETQVSRRSHGACGSEAERHAGEEEAEEDWSWSTARGDAGAVGEKVVAEVGEGSVEDEEEEEGLCETERARRRRERVWREERRRRQERAHKGNELEEEEEEEEEEEDEEEEGSVEGREARRGGGGEREAVAADGVGDGEVGAGVGGADVGGAAADVAALDSEEGGVVREVEVVVRGRASQVRYVARTLRRAGLAVRSPPLVFLFSFFVGLLGLFSHAFVGPFARFRRGCISRSLFACISRSIFAPAGLFCMPSPSPCEAPASFSTFSVFHFPTFPFA